jgi:hypothetical protein
MEANDMSNAWLELVKQISDEKHESKNSLICPKCGNSSMDYQYVGDTTTRIGYLVIWCKACLHGIHMSRTKAPVNASILPFNTSKEMLAKRIPNFTLEHLN